MSTSNHSNTGVTRRGLLAGVSAGLAVSAMPLNAFAGIGNTMPGALPLNLTKPNREATLAKYLCREVHSKIADKLDAVIADPAIDGERTSLALMEARCPGCGERVEPATSRISAVIPQWKLHLSGPQKFGVTA